MAPKTDSSLLSENNSMIILANSAPPRPITHTTFGYITQINLKNIGLDLCDIPYSFGWELVLYVGTIPCPISSAAGAGSLGFQEQFLTNSETFDGDFEPCSSSPLETTQRTGDVFFDDLFFDLKEDSDEKSGENPVQKDDSVPLVSRTGEKRKRVKTVARRTRTPRTRPQPRSRPSLTPSSPPSQPPRKSARIVFKSTPRTSKPSVPIVEEISSSTEGFSSSDSEDTTFKQGTPVFSESSEDQAPPKTATKPAVRPSPAKTPLKRKPRTTPLP